MEKELSISTQSLSIIKKMQQNEITESAIYEKISSKIKNEHNKKTLLRLSKEEKAHYDIWLSYTNEEMKPKKLKVWWYSFLSTLLGFTFAAKKMENGEEIAQEEYTKLSKEVPESKIIMKQEEEHEKALLEILDEERLKYVGSMVLGLNDALVELTGTLAGLTLAIQDTRIIALSGLITGISATFSMASSEFLSAKSEGRSDALKSCIYTGIAYVVTVILLILPYLIFPESKYMYALISMLVIVVLIILVFNYYISVAKDLNFKHRFLEMIVISLGVAGLSFIVGLVVKAALGVDI